MIYKEDSDQDNQMPDGFSDEDDYDVFAKIKTQNIEKSKTMNPSDQGKEVKPIAN